MNNALLLLRPILLSTGEPAGIGGEIALKAARDWVQKHSTPLVLVGDIYHLGQLNQTLGLGLSLQKWQADAAVNTDVHVAEAPNTNTQTISVLHVPLKAPVSLGVLDVRNAAYVLATLDAATDLLLTQQAVAVVTTPVHKGIINDAGVAFSGHTEYFAERAGVNRVVMMLSGGGLNVALATTHLPLKDVPAAITAASLDDTLGIIQTDMQRYFGIAHPKIWLTGLNPHSGEGGHLGREEIDVISPAIARAQQRGIDAQGPYPADTVFCHRDVSQADCILAMYHDQGLAVLKYASFGLGVNITLGLPFIRTSVDHGTALDIAAQGCAEHESLLVAIAKAEQMANARATSPR